MDCPQCNGKRLQAESLSVRILGKDIGDLSDMTAEAALSFLKSLPLSSGQAKLVAKVMKNACERLEFLAGVGLNYITISRKSGTLS